MNPAGGGAVNLSNNGAADEYPAWSNDGSQIAFASNRDGQYEIYTMSANGDGQTRITIEGASDYAPTWLLADSDGDGIPDASDTCPDNPGPQPDGCPPPGPPAVGGSAGLLSTDRDRYDGTNATAIVSAMVAAVVIVFLGARYLHRRRPR